jgi:hypothetical protein
LDDLFTPAVLARLRWNAEIAYNSFDTLEAEAAGKNAWWHLRAILNILDHLDDTHSLARILGVVGLEPRIGLERGIGNRNAR